MIETHCRPLGMAFSLVAGGAGAVGSVVAVLASAVCVAFVFHSV